MTEPLDKKISEKINLIETEYPECGNAIGMLEDIKQDVRQAIKNILEKIDNDTDYRGKKIKQYIKKEVGSLANNSPQTKLEKNEFGCGGKPKTIGLLEETCRQDKNEDTKPNQEKTA